MVSMTTKKLMKNKKKNVVNKPIISEKALKYFRWVLLGLLMIVVFYPPYLRGLYFEQEQLPTEIFVFIIFIAFCVYKFLKKDHRFLETPIDYAAFGFVVVYFVSIFVAVSTRSAIAEWLKYCMFFVVFLMLSELCNTMKSRMLILWTMVSSAGGVSLMGIDALAGGKTVNSINNLLKAFGTENDVFFGLFVTGRINSTLQYPNALAAYLMAIFFVLLGLVISSKSVLVKIIGKITSYILVITLLLTFSRGAYLLFPIAGIIFLILLPNKSKIQGIIYILPSIGGITFTYPQLSDICLATDVSSTLVWNLILRGVVITGIVSVVILVSEHFINKRLNSRPILRKVLFRGLIISSIIVFIISLISGYILINVKADLVLKHENSESDSYKYVTRYIDLKPGEKYKISYDIKSRKDTNSSNYVYQLEILSKSIAEILSNKSTQLVLVQEKESHEFKECESIFITPEDSKSITVTFANFFSGTSVQIQNAKIEPIGHNDKIYELNLNPKYVPENIYSRFNETKSSISTLQRYLYTVDGLKMIKDHIVFGAGGGAWPTIYFTYQSYLYWSTQAHNYFIQIGVECGIIGICILILLMASLIISFLKLLLKEKSENVHTYSLLAGLSGGIAALLMHSMMDFDLSLSAVFLVLWQIIAIFISIEKNDVNSTTKANPILKKIEKIKLKNVLVNPVFLILVIIPPLIFSSLFIIATNAAKSANKYLINQNLSKGIEKIERAATYDTFSPMYKIDYANLVIQRGEDKIQQNELLKAKKFVEIAEKQGKNSVDACLKLAKYYLGTTNIDKGLYYIDRAVQLRPLEPSQWQQKADVYMQVAQFYNSNKDYKKADEYIYKVLSIPSEAKEVNKNNIVPFTLNAATDELIGRAKYYKQNRDSVDNIDLNRIVFNSVNEQDVNSDNRPDQWFVTDAEVKLGINNENITVEKTTNNESHIKTRPLNLKPNQSYEVKIKLSECKVPSLKIEASNMSQSTKELKLVDGYYTGIINTPSEIKDKYSELIIFLNQSVQIESAIIAEK